MGYKNRQKRYKTCKCKCPVCSTTFTTRDSLYTHVESFHPDFLQKGVSTSQHMFNMRQKPPTPNRRHGECRICKTQTPWNENVELYDQYCGKQSCRDAARAKVVENLEKVYGKGTTTLADRPEHQIKCLRGKKMSDIMMFPNADGEMREVWYVGSYEKHFLNMLKLIGFKFEDVMDTPPYTFTYDHDGEEKYHIPDFYLPGLNLMVEISASNKHPEIMATTALKKKSKFAHVKTQTKYNYIEIIDKKYNAFYTIVELIRNQIHVASDPSVSGNMRDTIVHIGSER